MSEFNAQNKMQIDNKSNNKFHSTPLTRKYDLRKTYY